MGRGTTRNLRTGFTTGACAAAAAASACRALLTGHWTDPVTIRLPKGQTPAFPLEIAESGPGWTRAAVRKDAGDDPDVTHNALIIAKVVPGAPGSGISFLAGPGVGTVTKPGLPLEVGEPAINPAPRRLIRETLAGITAELDRECDFDVEISVPGGEALALKTWNPRLGIEGGLSILGTTGIVKPYSCAAWIASIHLGVDVARANGFDHVVASTGSTSESAAQGLYGLPDGAMLDMGDFAGGLLKYVRRHPVSRITIAGGFAKLTKLAQGATDLHSSRSQVDFGALESLARNHCGTLGSDALECIRSANTAKQALDIAGPGLADAVADGAMATAERTLRSAPTQVEVMVFDRNGALVSRRSRVPFPPLSGRT